MPVYRGEEIGLERDAKVLLFNDGAVTGRYAAARRIKGEPGVDAAKLDKVAMDAVYEITLENNVPRRSIRRPLTQNSW